MGRPKKKNPVSSGYLQPGLCRFSFIADDRLIERIKRSCGERDIYIKDFMNDAISKHLKNLPSPKNEKKLLEHLKKIKQ